jgi:hypothetical protein
MDLDALDTLIVRTGSGGFHFYFLHPGFYVRCSKGSERVSLAPGVDIRGDGGWVVGPGSPHKSGNAYYVVRDRPIIHAPAWLLAWPGLQGQAPRHLSETWSWMPTCPSRWT